MSHLDTIANRQRGSRVRDLAFAAAVVLASIVSMSSVAVAAHAAQTTASR